MIEQAARMSQNCGDANSRIVKAISFSDANSVSILIYDNIAMVSVFAVGEEADEAIIDALLLLHDWDSIIRLLM